MELFQVRYFLALTKTLNFTRAAETCHVSQPALTRAIQRLEEELGGPLLYRERNQTQLTALGRAMAPHLGAAYAAAESAAAQAVAFRVRATPPLRLGIGEGLSPHLPMSVLRELQAHMKGFEFSLAEGRAEDLSERMLSDSLDSALLALSDKLPERLNRWTLFEDRYAVLCLADHPFAMSTAVEPTALAGQCLLLPGNSGSHAGLALDRLAAESGIELDARHTGASEAAVQQMVAAGLGLSLSAMHRPLPMGLVAIPIAHAAAQFKVVVTTVAGRPHGPSLDAFLKLMRARDWRRAAGAASQLLKR
ncbi:MAG TPA: LysR family transcriptional regulator [Candidatus Udaeobacter sp.]|nr:LysR family transcriptional regulator [Candidatus Udaeobacter sp.]